MEHQPAPSWPAGTRVRLLRPLTEMPAGQIGMVVHSFWSIGACSILFEPWSALTMVDVQDLELVAAMEPSAES